MAGHTLDLATAERFSRVALGHVEREYPNKLDHVINGPDDVRSPHELHPVFYGSFDWHSCVHGYWLLATLLRLHPEMATAADVRALFDRQLTPEKVDAEVAYLRQPLRASFERPYGWGWLLMLSAELSRHQGDQGKAWCDALRPLARAFVERFRTFLPKATYPIRVGTHFNTAFAIRLAWEYAEAVRDIPFSAVLREKAMGWYGSDVDVQEWEPGGDDFLSSALVEVECMRVVLKSGGFPAWLERFLPRLAHGEPPTLLEPPIVSDRSDGKIAHLDGLNFSRAWCWRGIARSASEGSPLRKLAAETADRHIAASWVHVSGDYMGEHWLATFALLALLA